MHPIDPPTSARGNPHKASVVASVIPTAFADRSWSTQTLDGAPCFRAFFVRRGAGAFVRKGSAPVEIAAPQILWLPYAERGELHLRAGGDGATLLASEDVVWRIIAENPLGAQMRPLLARTLLAPGDKLSLRLVEIDSLFAALEHESSDPGPGAPAMVALYMGLLLMHLWRSCGLSAEGDSLDTGAPTAQRFRQLVELHYRDNLDVDAFARRLGVTRSHLHSACLRALGKAPQQFVHERLIAEARFRLRETAQSIEQIAYSLGFRDSAYFSRFFRRLAGMPPGAYRKVARVAPAREPTSYSAWP